MVIIIIIIIIIRRFVPQRGEWPGSEQETTCERVKLVWSYSSILHVHDVLLKNSIIYLKMVQLSKILKEFSQHTILINAHLPACITQVITKWIR